MPETTGEGGTTTNEQRDGATALSSPGLQVGSPALQTSGAGGGQPMSKPGVHAACGITTASERTGGP